MRLDNPCSGTVIPAKMLTVEEIENSPIEDGYLEKHELAEFLNAVNEHGLPDNIEIFHLLAFSGMRSGELCALKDTDFNFELNELRITKTLYNPDNNMRKYTLTPPKSTGSIRKFNIIDNVMNLLQRHIVKQQALRLEYKKLFDDYHENNFVLPTRTATHSFKKYINPYGTYSQENLN